MCISIAIRCFGHRLKYRQSSPLNFRIGKSVVIELMESVEHPPNTNKRVLLICRSARGDIRMSVCSLPGRLSMLFTETLLNAGRCAAALGIASGAACSALFLIRRCPLEDGVTSRTCQELHTELSGVARSPATLATPYIFDAPIRLACTWHPPI